MQNSKIKIEEDLEQIRNTYYQDIPENIFLSVISIDPTFVKEDQKLGKYGKGLLTMFKRAPEITEDAQEISDQLMMFDQSKNKYDVNDRDINKIKTISDLIDLNHKYEQKSVKSQFEIRAEEIPGVKIIGSTPNWEIYQPLTGEASKYLRGQNAVGCTGRHNDDSYGKSYVERHGDKLLIFINKNNRDDKYQGAFRKKFLGQDSDRYVAEFRDAQNTSIPFIDFLNENPEILNLLKSNSEFKDLQELKTIEIIQRMNQGVPYAFTDSSPEELNSNRYLRHRIKYIDVKTTTLNPSQFSDMESLEKVILPEGLEQIPLNCFCNCRKLKDVKISDSVKVIGPLAFSKCGDLEKVNLPQSLQEIGFGAFDGCENVELSAIKGSKILIKRVDLDFIKQHIKWEDKHNG